MAKQSLHGGRRDNEDHSTAAVYQAVSELPQANRDVLAFLMIHPQRVAQSPNTKMDSANLAKVFGPTIVVHTVPNPDPKTMFQDIKCQLRVGGVPAFSAPGILESVRDGVTREH